MQKKEIVFKSGTSYSQKQNSISERMGRALIDIIRAIILESIIKDELWLELVLSITYIKNSHPIKAIANNLSSHKAHFYKKLDLLYLQILDTIIYLLLHEEKCIIKSEK